MGQFKDPELALAKEVVLQAQAQTTKWVTMTLVVSCVGVMGVTGIVMGVYLSGNLGKGDDSDDIQNSPVMAEAMKGVNLDSGVDQNHLDHSISNPKTVQSRPTSPLSDGDDDDHQNTISSSKIQLISNAKERQRDFLASEINGLNMIGKRMMALLNLPKKLIASPIIVPPSAVNEDINTEIPTGKLTIPENTVPLPNEVTIGPNIRDFTIPSNINSITNNILHDVQGNPKENMIYNQGHDDEDESFEFDSPEITEKTEEGSEEQRNEAEKTSEENSVSSEEVVEKTDTDNHSKEISVLEVHSSDSSVEMGSSAGITRDESSSEETDHLPEADVTSLESVKSSEKRIAEGQSTVSKDDGSSSQEDINGKQISKEADVSSQSSSSNDDSIQEIDDSNNAEFVKPAEKDYDYNFEYENTETNDKFKAIVATSLTLPYKTNSKESMENLRSNAISVDLDNGSSDSYDSEEHSATKSKEIEHKDGIYTSIGVDSNEALGSPDHSFEIAFQTVYSKTSKDAESGSISSEKNNDVLDKVQMSLGIDRERVSSEELSSETQSDKSDVAQQSSELKQSKLSRFPESDTSSEKDSDKSSTEKNSKKDIDDNSNESLAESKSEEKSKIDKNTGSYEYSANDGSSSSSNEESVVESGDADSSKHLQDERLNSDIGGTSSSEEEEGRDDIEFSAESSAHDGSISTNEISDSLEDTHSQNENSVEAENKKSSESSISKKSSEIDSTNEISDSIEDTHSQNENSEESENKESSDNSISKKSSEIDSTNEISDSIEDTHSQNENSEESENKDSKEAASEESLSNSQSKQNIKDSLIDDSSSVVSESSENDDSKITNANYTDSLIIKYESQSHEASSSTDSSEELSAENNEDSGVVESVSADNDSKTKGDDDVNSGNDLDEESKEDTAESDIIDQDVSKQIGDESADHSKSESTESSNESNNSDQSDEDLEKLSEKHGHNSDENLKENGSSQQKDGSSQNIDEQTKSSSVLMGILSNTMDSDKLESSDFDQIKLDERSRESFDAHKLNSNNLEDKSSEETSDELNDRSSKSVDGIETPNNDLSVVDVDIPFSINSQDSDFYSSYLYHEELHKSNNFEMSLSEKTDANSKEERSQKQSGGSKDSKESKESDINNRQVIGEPRNDNLTDNYYDENMFTDFLRGILENGKENMVHNPPTPHSVGTDYEDTESGESLEKSRQDGIKTNGSTQVDNNESIESQESKNGADAINPWTSQSIGNQINEKPSTSEFFRFGLTRNPFENGVIHGITNGFNAFVTTPRPFVPAADYDDDHDKRRQQGRSLGLVGVSDDQTGGISSWNNGQHHLNTFPNPHFGLNNHNGHGHHFGNEMIGQHQNFGLMGFSDTSSLGMQPNISPYNGGNTFSFHDLNHQPETSHLNHDQSQDFSVHGNNNHHIESQWMPHESGIQGNWDQTLPQVTAPQQLSPELGTNEQNSKAAEGGPLAMELPTLENIPQQLSPEFGTNEQYSHAAESGPAAMELPTLENIPQNNLPSAVGDNLLSSSPSATGSDLASSFPSHLDNRPFSSSSLAHQDPVNDAWSTGNKQASLDEASRPDRNIFLDPQTNYFSNGVQRVAFGTPNEQLNFNINLINEQPQLNNNQPVSNTQQNYGNNNHFNPQTEISAPFKTIQTLPHYVDQAAHYVDKVPHHVDQATHSVDQTPHSVKQVNTHDEDSEERDDESSAGSNTSSMSSFVQPSEVYRNPFAVNDDVSEDQDHQQVNHNQHVETTHTDNENDNNSNEDDNENEDDTER
ncbi:uncharacterized protein LOC111102459 [Crassostrea virginica]